MFQGKTEWIKTIKRREKVIECYEIYRKIKTCNSYRRSFRGNIINCIISFRKEYHTECWIVHGYSSDNRWRMHSGFVLQRTRGMPKMAQYMEGPDMADCWLYYISHCNYCFDICILLRKPLCQFLDVCPDYDKYINQAIRYYRNAVRFGMDDLSDVNELANRYPESRPMINRKKKTDLKNN